MHEYTSSHKYTINIAFDMLVLHALARIYSIMYTFVSSSKLRRSYMDAIGIGDLHLTGTSGAGAWSKYWPGNSDAAILQEAQKAVDYGKSKGIANIFLYGDICDAPKMSYQAHQALLDFFSRNFDCQFYIILGNHEMLTANSSTHALSLIQAFGTACPNVHIYDKPTLEKVRFL